MHPDERVQLAPARPQHLRGDSQPGVIAKRQVRDQPAPPPDQRDGADGLPQLPRDELDELGHRAPFDEVVAELLRGGKPGEHAAADLLEVAAREIEELVAVVVTDLVEVPHIKPQIVAERLPLVAS